MGRLGSCLGGAIRREGKNREKFRETRVAFTKCTITKIVIWLLKILGLCLQFFGTGSLECLPSGRQVVTLRP